MTDGQIISNGAHPSCNGGSEDGQLISGDEPQKHHPLAHPLEVPSDEFDPSDIVPLDASPTSPATSNSNSLDDSPEPPSDLGSVYIRISVSKPQKIPEVSNSIVPGSNSYYTYLITTTTNLPELLQGRSDGNFSVRRRFKDLVALSDRLSESYRGFFVPLRPDKSVIEGQVMDKTEFVEHRRAAIEKYLRKLAAHPVICRGNEFRLFLTTQDGVFAARGGSPSVVTREENREVEAAGQRGETMLPGGGGGKDWWKVFRELKQSVVNDWGGSKPLVVEDDKMFLDKKQKLEELRAHLNTVSQQAESLVSAQQEVGQTMGDLGMTLIKLVKLESQTSLCDPQRVGAASMHNASKGAIKASRLYRALNGQTVKHLDVLHDYLGTMLGADNAFADRSSALLNIQSLTSQISSLQSKIENLELSATRVFGGDRTSMVKIEELKHTLTTTENSKDHAVKDYEQIKENNHNEFVRLDKERRADFVNMIKGFAVSQAEYSEKLAATWEAVVEDTSKYSVASS